MTDPIPADPNAPVTSRLDWARAQIADGRDMNIWEEVINLNDRFDALLQLFGQLVGEHGEAIESIAATGVATQDRLATTAAIVNELQGNFLVIQEQQASLMQSLPVPEEL